MLTVLLEATSYLEPDEIKRVLTVGAVYSTHVPFAHHS